MLTARLLMHAAVAALAFCVVSPDAHAAKKPPKKHVVELVEEPVDYSDFEKRRQKNIKEGLAGQTRALSSGYAGRTDLGTAVVVADEPLQQKIAAELKKLIPAGIAAPPIEIIIVDDLGMMSHVQTLQQNDEVIKALSAASAGDFNAEATSGAGMIVPLGTLVGTKSIDELDFLLAHESAHILYDHFDALETRDLIRQIAGATLLVATLVSRYGDADTARSIALTAVGVEIANQLLGPAWDRKQEIEADETGLEMLMDAGMSADGAMNVIKQIALQDKKREEKLDLICGPDSAGERFLKRLLTSAIGIRIPDKGLDPTNPVCAARNDLLGEWMDDHPDPEDRREALVEHRKLWYGDIDSRPTTTFMDEKGNPYDNFVQFASPDGDANRRLLAYQGIKAFHDGDVTSARATLKKIATRGDAEVLVPVLMLHYYVLNYDKKRGEALRFLDLATRAPQVEPYTFDMAIDEYEKDARWADSVRIIELRQVRVGYADEMLPRLITASRRAGDNTKMQATLEACRKVSRSDIVARCEQSALPDPPPEAAAPPAAGAGAAGAPPAAN
jgi:Zn-dependent protease with chaperone function